MQAVAPRTAATRRRIPVAWLALGCVSLSLGHAGRVQAQVVHSVTSSGPAAVGENVTFTCVAQGQGTLRYLWRFGDGSDANATYVPNAATVQHSYAKPGHYGVQVLVKDDTSPRPKGGPSLQQVIHWPLTPDKPTHSSSILHDPARNRVYNVNPDNDTLSVIDAPPSGPAGTPDPRYAKLAEIPVGKGPRALARDGLGRLWVALQWDDAVVIVDPDRGAVVETLPLPYASQPFGLAMSPDGTTAYVTLRALGQVARFDAMHPAQPQLAPVGPWPEGIAVTHDGQRIFVSRFVSPETHGEVHELNPNLVLVRTIRLEIDPGPDSDVSGRGVPNFLRSLVISPDGRSLAVTGKKDNIERGPKRDGLDMNPDNFVRPMLGFIDLETGSERLDARHDLDDRSLPTAALFSPLGDYVFVAVTGNNTVGVRRANVDQRASDLRNVGLAPMGLALSPDHKLFVHGQNTRTVVVYDVRSIAISEGYESRKLAEIPVVEHEQLAPEVLLGKQVFYNAEDPRMSTEGYIACATCHLEGMSDGRVWDFTNRGEGLRNTKTLFGIRGVGHGRVHWSANFDEIQDFERDIRHSLGGRGFMPDQEWARREADPFGIPAAGASVELDALAAYITHGLGRFPRSPYRNPDGSFTEQAKLGYQVFQMAGCPGCHIAPDFTDSALGVLHDVGTILPSSGQRLGGALSGLDTPTLKGLWASAPYLHDGRAPTLKQIFTEHNPHDKLGVTSNLSNEQLDQLVSFLQQLDDRPDPDGIIPPPPLGANPSTAGSMNPPPPAGVGPETSGPPANCGCGVLGRSPEQSWDGVLGLFLGLGLCRRSRGRRAS